MFSISICHVHGKVYGWGAIQCSVHACTCTFSAWSLLNQTEIWVQSKCYCKFRAILDGLISLAHAFSYLNWL